MTQIHPNDEIEKEIEEIDVTALIERIEALEKNNSETKAEIEEFRKLIEAKTVTVNQVLAEHAKHIQSLIECCNALNTGSE